MDPFVPRRRAARRRLSQNRCTWAKPTPGFEPGTPSLRDSPRARDVTVRGRQEIVSGAEHRNQQQVEVGEHLGPLGSAVIASTAGFDPLRYVPFNPTHDHPVVELLI
jgi:hypothetical protein